MLLLIGVGSSLQVPCSQTYNLLENSFRGALASPNQNDSVGTRHSICVQHVVRIIFLFAKQFNASLCEKMLVDSLSQPKVACEKYYAGLNAFQK